MNMNIGDLGRRGTEMRVKELMTTQVKACQPSDSLNRAAQIMWENDCGCVPVTDPSGKAVGMLTDRDICMAAYTQGRVLAAMTVSSAMSKTIVACRMNDSVTSAERLMRQRRVRRLPVLAVNGRLAGLLSLSDMARRARLAGKEREKAGFEEVGETLASICEQPHSGEVSASEAWVAWTGTATTPRRGRTPGKEPGTLASTKTRTKAAKRASKPATREKP